MTTLSKYTLLLILSTVSFILITTLADSIVAGTAMVLYTIGMIVLYCRIYWLSKHTTLLEII